MSPTNPKFPWTSRVTISSFVGGPQDGLTTAVRPEVTEVHFRLNMTDRPPPGDPILYIYARTGPTTFRYRCQKKG